MFRPTTGPLLQISQRFAMFRLSRTDRNGNCSTPRRARTELAYNWLTSPQVRSNGGSNANRILQGAGRVGAVAPATPAQRVDLVLPGRSPVPIRPAGPPHPLRGRHRRAAGAAPRS